MKKILTLIFASLFAFSFLAPLSAQEDIIPLEGELTDSGDDADIDFPYYDNHDTDHIVAIWDYADALTDDEESKLIAAMSPFTKWGDSLFLISDDESEMDSKETAESLMKDYTDRAIFVVDLYRKEMYLHTTGAIHDVIDEDISEAIVDGIVESAANGDFCAGMESAYENMISLLSDGKSPAPYEPLTYTNSENSLSAKVMDEADLLSAEEEKMLLSEMQNMTQWGNALFYTTTQNAGVSSQELAAITYERVFGKDSDGSIFLIDMNQRRLEIRSYGAVYGTITNDYAQTITDNIYKKASGGNYYDCASEAFKQMTTLLAGGKIRQPMKYISNYLLALALALIICYFYMRSQPKTSNEKAQPKADPVFNGTINNISVTKGRLSSRVIQSSSSGGGRSGGGGGGGHSGGGGGHSF